LVTDLAAANCYKLDHLKEHWDIVEKSKAYFVGGYHLTVCVPAIMALAEEAAAKNKVCTFFTAKYLIMILTVISPSLSPSSQNTIPSVL
jgi:hypothetical protein